MHGRIEKFPPDFAEELFSTPGQGCGAKFWSAPGVPRYPLPDEMIRVRVPRPPRLPENMDDDNKFRTIVRSFLNLHNFHYGFNPFSSVYKHIGYPKGFKHYQLIIDAAGLLVRYQLAPIIWTKFSFAFWDAYVQPIAGKKKKRKKLTPKMEWVFSSQLINKHYGWCSGLSQDFIGSKVIICTAHRELLGRLQSMRHALTTLSPKSDESSIQKVVTKYFSGNDYDNLIRKGNREAARMQSDLQALADDGEWLWHDITWSLIKEEKSSHGRQGRAL